MQSKSSCDAIRVAVNGVEVQTHKMVFVRVQSDGLHAQQRQQSREFMGKSDGL